MAVVTQPTDPFGIAPGTTGEVTVRTATESDAAFVCRCEIYAFEDKTAHVIGKDRFEPFIGALVENFPFRKISYHRIFVAEYNGVPAGVMELAYQDDYQEQEGGSSSPFCQAVGCCAVLRFGCMESCITEKPPQSQCYLAILGVAEGFRGKGIGKVLLERADWEAKRNNCEAIYLHVVTTNRAKNLYLRHGYERKSLQDYGCCVKCLMGVSKFDKMVKPLH